MSDSDTPYLDAAKARQEREAQVDHVADWLQGRAAPLDDRPRTPAKIEIEIGPERPEPDGTVRDAPGITVIRSEDDYVERHGSYSVLRPGKRNRQA